MPLGRAKSGKGSHTGGDGAYGEAASLGDLLESPEAVPEEPAVLAEEG